MCCTPICTKPVSEREWDTTHSIKMVQQLTAGRMYPLTLERLDRAMREPVRWAGCAWVESPKQLKVPSSLRGRLARMPAGTLGQDDDQQDDDSEDCDRR